MGSFSDAIRGKVKQGLCSVISTVDSATALIRRKAVGDVLDDVSFPAFLNRLVCDRDMPSTPPPPPFTGGQCCNKEYIISFTYDSFAFNGGVCQPQSFGVFDGSVQRPGKVKAVRQSADGRNIEYVREDCDGNVLVSELTQKDQFCRKLLSYSVAIAPGYGADNCGDTEPTLQPLSPGWNTYNDNLSYTNNQGNNITVPIGMAFGYADVDINGSLSIPVKVDVGGIKVNVNFNLNTGDIQFFPTNDYGSRKPGNQPTDYLPLPGIEPPDYPPNLPPPLLPIGEEDRDTEPVIVGVLVTTESVETGKISTLFQEDNPSIKIPSLGHVSFLCRVGFMESAWTSDIPVKNVRNLITCPWPGGAIRVAGTPQPGVSWTLTPIYSKKNSPIILPIEETS